VKEILPRGGISCRQDYVFIIGANLFFQLQAALGYFGQDRGCGYWLAELPCLKDSSRGQFFVFDYVFVAIGLKPFNFIFINHRQAYSRDFKKLKAVNQSKFFWFFPSKIDRPVEAFFQPIDPAFFTDFSV